jgi:hypothetical protein
LIGRQGGRRAIEAACGLVVARSSAPEGQPPERHLARGAARPTPRWSVLRPTAERGPPFASAAGHDCLECRCSGMLTAAPAPAPAPAPALGLGLWPGPQRRPRRAPPPCLACRLFAGRLSARLRFGGRLSAWPRVRRSAIASDLSLRPRLRPRLRPGAGRSRQWSGSYGGTLAGWADWLPWPGWVAMVRRLRQGDEGAASGVGARWALAGANPIRVWHRRGSSRGCRSAVAGRRWPVRRGASLETFVRPAWWGSSRQRLIQARKRSYRSGGATAPWAVRSMSASLIWAAM